jgi:hypothetical protein
MLAFGGVVRLSVPAPVQAGCGDGPHRPISRCSLSKACVADPGRMRTAEAIGRVLVNETENGWPWRSRPDGTLVIWGRAVVISSSFASNRYGGV